MKNTEYKHDKYTEDEIQVILDFIKEGHSPREISELTHRSRGAIYTLAYKVRKGQMENTPKKETKSANYEIEGSVVKTKDIMTPRDMIKALYDMGYRIENNQLVCYVKQVVKVSDIIR